MQGSDDGSWRCSHVFYVRNAGSGAIECLSLAIIMSGEMVQMGHRLLLVDYFLFTRRDTLLDRYTCARNCPLSTLEIHDFYLRLSYRCLLSTIFVHSNRHRPTPLNAISVPNGTLFHDQLFFPRGVRPHWPLTPQTFVRSKRGQSERRANEGGTWVVGSEGRGEAQKLV